MTSKKTIHVNDTLAVYRTSPSCEVTPIGIIRVISFVGETYIKGEVFAGEIKPDDIAKKENVSCLVISAEMCVPRRTTIKKKNSPISGYHYKTHDSQLEKLIDQNNS